MINNPTNMKAPGDSAASTQHEPKAAAAPQVLPQVIDLNDPKSLLGVLASMFQSQAESNEINRKLLEIKMREEDARLKKDADALSKWERARKAALDELKNKDTNDKRRFADCSHKDRNKIWTIWPISNFPDGRLRGYCSQCGMPIHPEHYEYDAEGKPTRVPEHQLYHIVIERDRDIYSGFLPVMTY